MEKYIAKVRTYYNDECIEHGTGIMVSLNSVLTPRHVINGDRCTVCIDDVEYNAHVIKENDSAVILYIDKLNYPYDTAKVFSNDEIFQS